MDKTFKDFFDTYSHSLTQSQAKRVVKNFNGTFSPEELTTEFFAEVNNSIFNVLQCYNDWLFANFDIVPKKNEDD